MADFTKAQLAEKVKTESKIKIQNAKSEIEESKKRIDKAKSDIKSAKKAIKAQKAVIKAAKDAVKTAKAEAKAEAASIKAAKKAEKAAAQAEKASEKAVSEDETKPTKKAVVSAPAPTAAEESSEPLGMFYIKGASGDSFMFNLLSSDNKIIATSQIYTTIDACYNGIQSIITNAKSAPLEDQTKEGFASLPHPKFELYIDKGGSDYRFRLKAKNGQNIVASPAFKTKEECLAGVEAVRKNSQTKNIRKEV